ncbi:MAG: hypothetical protein PUC18_12485 [Prevotellaceae bacterium]|nr:hypothetical protein [Prevotellaceae bacterium]
MAKKKQAGTERPYTWYEFFRIIRNIVEEEQVVMHDELDYFDTDNHWSDKPIDLSYWDWWVVSETQFGGNEGVYTDFYMRLEGEPRRHIATAKTLNEGDKAYVNMHEFGARVCLAINKYVREHEDEFNWSGYDVGYWQDGKRVTFMLAHKYENALKYARDYKARNDEPWWVRDNAKRTYEEV